VFCNKCYEKISQNDEVKLRNGSIVCNKCAIRIQKEYHKKRYQKYLNGEIKWEELDPEGKRPINIEFLEVLCTRCSKSLTEKSEKVVAKSSAIVYDKCKGKKCSDCGKMRRLDRIEMSVSKNGYAGFMCICPRCQKKTGYKFNGICWDCFWEREEEGGCICISKQYNLSKTYYCFLCEDIHALEFWCDECAKLIKEGSIIPLGRKLVRPWKIIVPSVFSGFVLGVIATFLVSRRTLKKRAKSS